MRGPFPEMLKARVWVFGDNISTDEIIPGKRLAEREIQKLAVFAFENLKESFWQSVREGDVIVSGRNFGCGSSREQAALVIKALGIKIILAESFGRIFFRNCVNNGILPLRLHRPLKDLLVDGDEIQINFKENLVVTQTT
ncbi:MAG: 3-isopropylmalate dehydratase, partial [Thermoplasmata archaeon]